MAARCCDGQLWRGHRSLGFGPVWLAWQWVVALALAHAEGFSCGRAKNICAVRRL